MNHPYILYKKRRENAKIKLAEILNENISCFESCDISFSKLRLFLDGGYFFLPLFYYWEDIKGLKYKRYVTLENLRDRFAKNEVKLFSDHLELSNTPTHFYYVKNFTSEDNLRYIFHYH